jgi:hypothetical protein
MASCAGSAVTSVWASSVPKLHAARGGSAAAVAGTASVIKAKRSKTSRTVRFIALHNFGTHSERRTLPMRVDFDHQDKPPDRLIALQVRVGKLWLLRAAVRRARGATDLHSRELLSREWAQRPHSATRGHRNPIW